MAPDSNAPSLDRMAEIEREARDGIAHAADGRALEDWRIHYLGRNGVLTNVLRGLRDVPPNERREVGAAANALKTALEDLLASREAGARRADLDRRLASAPVDVTLPGRSPNVGRLHPVTQTLREAIAAFETMGFHVAEGPEVEWDVYNFQKLRMPPDHPARAMQDTFYVDYKVGDDYPMLLRTQTSPNQIRVMERQQPPVRVVVPGRAYRNEATDPTHEWMLTQLEVLAVDTG
ncbi:MAG TPA: phenylalanine--tRNA ligase subunit alpha, partial [Dehalococcoidia bacterium]|nr:phenylalanine--tRNA ligase subunit alpha [Dehalococcoidia bacterium]